ncbi:MAG: ABC transporter ATP-binding protein [Planctomycetota bacterium]
MIFTQDLTRKYGRLTAVRHVSLHVPRNTIFGFIGPNGAGKTTTLRMLATLLRPTDGRIAIDGIDVVANPLAARRRIGYLSDDFGLYDDLKVWEYLDYFCGAYGLDAGPEDLESLLYLVQLNHKREDLVGQLSRGMRQRLGIARMLVYQPKVVLLDEPANGLDPMARIALRDLLKTLRDKGATVVVSSHILTELSDMCDTVGIMELGRLIAAGSIETILAQTRKQWRLVLEVLGPQEQAVEVLQSVPQVVNIARQNDKLEMGFTGKREDLPALHKKLVEAGVPVVAFFPKAENLEDLFMRLSTGATN